jgi:chromosome segregation ATPase
MKDNMQLTSFRAENFQRINLIEMEFEPGGGLTIIGGKNRSGKSSFLDAIVALISGPKGFNSTPVKHGADQAVLTGMIGDLEVTRTIKPDGSQKLRVRSPEGFTAHKPQTMLSKLVATVSIDPLEIMQMEPQKLADVLKQLTGVDTAELDAERKEMYDRRTHIGRDVKLLQGQLSGLTYHDELPSKPDVSQIVAAIDAIAAQNADNELQRQRLTECNGYKRTAAQLLVDAQGYVETLEVQLEAARQLVVDREAEYDRQHAESLQQTKIVEALEDSSDIDLRQELNVAEATIAAHADNERHAAKAAELQTTTKEYDSLSKAIQELDNKRKAMLAEANMPVPGLDFGDDGVTLNGLPWDMASGEEGFDACIRICKALNPEASFMLSKHGGKELDEENLARVGKLAEQFGLRLIVERPGTHDDNVIEICDGYLAETQQ